MNKKEYSSSIKKTPFEYIPSKIIAKKILSGTTYDVAYEECVKNNELNVVSDERRREIFNVVFERLVKLDSQLLKAFVESSIATSKFILVYAIADNDPLFMEFLLLQYREALIGPKKYISISDFDDFFATLKEKNITVAKWSDNTIRQISGGFRNILVESGLGDRVKKNIYTKRAIVNPAIVDRIDIIGGKAFLQAVLGVE